VTRTTPLNFVAGPTLKLLGSRVNEKLAGGGGGGDGVTQALNAASINTLTNDGFTIFSPPEISSR
jgi:hypothetical protein